MPKSVPRPNFVEISDPAARPLIADLARLAGATSAVVNGNQIVATGPTLDALVNGLALPSNQRPILLAPNDRVANAVRTLIADKGLRVVDRAPAVLNAGMPEMSLARSVNTRAACRVALVHSYSAAITFLNRQGAVEITTAPMQLARDTAAIGVALARVSDRDAERSQAHWRGVSDHQRIGMKREAFRHAVNLINSLERSVLERDIESLDETAAHFLAALIDRNVTGHAGERNIRLSYQPGDAPGRARAYSARMNGREIMNSINEAHPFTPAELKAALKPGRIREWLSDTSAMAPINPLNTNARRTETPRAANAESPVLSRSMQR